MLKSSFCIVVATVFRLKIYQDNIFFIFQNLFLYQHIKKSGNI